MKGRISRVIVYRTFGIRAHNPEVGYPFAEILNRDGDYWDETECVETTQAAVREAKRMIDQFLEKAKSR